MQHCDEPAAKKRRINEQGTEEKARLEIEKLTPAEQKLHFQSVIRCYQTKKLRPTCGFCLAEVAHALYFEHVQRCSHLYNDLILQNAAVGGSQHEIGTPVRCSFQTQKHRRVLVFEENPFSGSEHIAKSIDLTTLQVEEVLRIPTTMLGRIFGYKQKCICCEERLFGKFDSVYLYDLDTKEKRHLNQFHELKGVFLHATQKGIVCFVEVKASTDYIVHYFDLKSGSVCKTARILTTTKLAQYCVFIGKYLVSLSNTTCNIYVYDTTNSRTQEPVTSIELLAKLVNIFPVSVFKFNKKQNELVVMLGPFFFLIRVENWLEEARITLTVIAQFKCVDKDYIISCIRLKPGLGYDYLLCSYNSLYWFKRENSEVKTCSNKARIKAKHSQIGPCLRVIATDNACKELAIYTWNHTTQLLEAQVLLMKSQGSISDVYIETPSKDALPLQIWMKKSQTTNQLTDVTITR